MPLHLLLGFEPFGAVTALVLQNLVMDCQVFFQQFCRGITFKAIGALELLGRMEFQYVRFQIPFFRKLFATVRADERICVNLFVDMEDVFAEEFLRTKGAL